MDNNMEQAHEGASIQTLKSETIDFQFKGKSGEYFSIWIVNVALTILTLGVYSAWAKVRTQQYFYGSTYLDGASFRYLANPKQILKGRIIAVLFFAAYFFSGLISYFVGAITVMILFLLVPYIITASMAFRARVSEWRHVRFGFDKVFSEAYVIAAIPLFLIAVNTLLPILLLDKDQIELLQSGDLTESKLLIVYGVVSLLLSLMFPGLDHSINRFRLKHSKYGNQYFSFAARMADFYKIYFIASFGFLIVLAVTIFGLSKIVPYTWLETIPWLAVIPLGLVYFLATAYVQAKRGNLIINNTIIGGHSFESRLSVIDMWVLYTTNTLAIVLSVGLLIPWAKVRTARYRASRTTLIAKGDLGGFAAQQRQQQSALGEEVGEMFDIGVGF